MWSASNACRRPNVYASEPRPARAGFGARGRGRAPSRARGGRRRRLRRRRGGATRRGSGHLRPTGHRASFAAGSLSRVTCNKPATLAPELIRTSARTGSTGPLARWRRWRSTRTSTAKRPTRAAREGRRVTRQRQLIWDAFIGRARGAPERRRRRQHVRSELPERERVDGLSDARAARRARASVARPRSGPRVLRAGARAPAPPLVCEACGEVEHLHDEVLGDRAADSRRDGLHARRRRAHALRALRGLSDRSVKDAFDDTS